jgi:hypothetical protein
MKMKYHYSAVVLILLFVIPMGILASGAAEVSSITADPDRYIDRSVTVSGYLGTTITLTSPIVPKDGEVKTLTLGRLMDSEDRRQIVLFVSNRQYEGREDIRVRAQVMRIIPEDAGQTAGTMVENLSDVLIENGIIDSNWDLDTILIRPLVYAISRISNALYIVSESSRTGFF